MFTHGCECRALTTVLQEDDAITAVSTFADRLRAEREALGLNQAEFAKRLGCSPGAIGNWEKDTRLPSSDMLMRLAEMLGVREEWLYYGTPPRVDGGQKLPDSGPRSPIFSDGNRIQIIATPVLEWEEVAMMDLPREFRLVMQDGAMAPQFKEGSVLLFSTQEGHARPLDTVLVADKSGNAYCRQYQQRTPEHWQAAALAPGYQPLDSERDGLRVLAIMVGSVSMGRTG